MNLLINSHLINRFADYPNMLVFLLTPSLMDTILQHK